MNRFVWVLLFCFGFVSIVKAQGSDEQLAAQYYSGRDFEKAAGLYEKLLNRNASSIYYYENLLQCYVQLSHFEQAEKLVKKQQRRFEGVEFYRVDLGYLYQKQGQTDMAKNYFGQLFKNFKGTESQTEGLAQAFQKRNEWDWAAQTYQRARKINGGNRSLYAMPLARLYATMRQTQSMVDEYLNALQDNPMLQEELQENLQLYIEEAADYEILKSALLKRSREQPQYSVFPELMVWMFVQKKDFASALIQARALDKRNREEGRRIFELGNLALSNGYYDDAVQAFQAAMQYGRNHPVYLSAQLGMLDANNQKITRSGIYTQQDLQALEQAYDAFLAEEGKSNFTASAMRELAKLRIYYLNKTASGIALIQELLEMPRLNDRFRAETKLLLGDVYILQDEVWEAVLLFGQVDKDFLDDPLGQEAKFRNARLSYYIGEFEWARAQLDVLKTATSQLIANDALELSLLIQDNTTDSIEEPLRLYAKADLCFYQRKPEQAIRLLDSIHLLYNRHALDDDILLKRAQICMQQNQWSDAINFLEQLIREHGTGIWGDNALFMLADIHEIKLKDALKAKQLYEQLLDQYPGSFFQTEVRKRYRNLRGDLLQE